MNIKNMKQARQWVKETPAKELDMSEYYGTETDDAEEVVSDCFSAEDFLRKNGWLPCGTTCCLAGLIHWKAATKKQLTNELPDAFAQNYLDLDHGEAEALFSDSDYYGRAWLHEVTKKDMLRALDQAIKQGHI